MTDEQKIDPRDLLYALVEKAEIQQRAVDQALAALDDRDRDLVRTIAQWQKVTQALTPALEKAVGDAAGEAVKTGLAAPGAAMTKALEDAAQPSLRGLVGIEREVGELAGKIKGAIAWFSWRWVVIAGATAASFLLLGYGQLFYVRSQVDDLRAQAAQLNSDIADGRDTLAQMQRRTGGVRYEEGDKGRFIVPANGYEGGWRCGGRDCIRLK